MKAYNPKTDLDEIRRQLAAAETTDWHLTTCKCGEPCVLLPDQLSQPVECHACGASLPNLCGVTSCP